MFHEREHSLHHSHEMTEKVGGERGLTWSFGTFGTPLCAPLYRRSWTTPVAAFSRFPTTGTQRKHRDSVSPWKDWGSGTEAEWGSPALLFSASCRKHNPIAGDEGVSFPGALLTERNCASQFLCKPEFKPGQRAALINTNSGGTRLHGIR